MLTTVQKPRLLSNLTESACIHVDVELVYRSGGDICGDLKWKECGIGLSLYPQMLLWYMTKTKTSTKSQ